MKKCSECAEVKPLEDYYKDKKMPDGRRGECKTCKNKKVMVWRAENKNKYNTTMRAYNKKHYSRLRLQRYELSEEAYNHMLKVQEGKCAVCGCEPKGKRPLAIDHCHDSGAVRGLLCYGCNRAIAILDNPEMLRKALAYLKK